MPAMESPLDDGSGVVDRYKVQSQGRYRAVTIPQWVELEPGDLVWVWSHQPVGEHDTTFLRVCTNPSGTNPTEESAEVLHDSYRIQQHGRGKRLTIPSDCDKQRFAPGAHVFLLRERDNGERVNLKIIPANDCSQAITALVAE